MFRASQQPLLWQRAMWGISCIENKLQSAQPTRQPNPARSCSLWEQEADADADVLKKSYTACRPTNGMPLYVTGTGGGRRRLM